MLNKPPKRGRRFGIIIDPAAVRLARAEAKLTLAQVADNKVSRTAIHLIETGKARPSLETLQLIAEKTQKPLSYFLADEPDAKHGAPTIELERAALSKEWVRVTELGEDLLTRGIDEATEGIARYHLGRAWVQLGNGRAALEYLEAASAIFDRVGDPWRSVECIDQTACAYFLLDDPRAQPEAEEALKRCRALRPVPLDLESRILGNLAVMHVQARRWQQAIYFYEECLKAGSQVTDIRHRALVYDGLSLAYQRLGNIAAATTSANKAIAMYTLQSDMASTALAENNLGDILMRSGHLDDAERHVRNGLKICNDYALHHRARSYGLLTLAEISMNRGRLDATAILHEAIHAAEAQNERLPIACAHQLLGRLAADEGNKDKAIAEFESATELLGELKMHERLRECLLEYATYMESVGEPTAHLWKRAALTGAELARPIRPFGTYLVESFSV